MFVNEELRTGKYCQHEGCVGAFQDFLNASGFGHARWLTQWVRWPKSSGCSGELNVKLDNGEFDRKGENEAAHYGCGISDVGDLGISDSTFYLRRTHIERHAGHREAEKMKIRNLLEPQRVAVLRFGVFT